MELMKTLINDESGQGLVEYALIVGLISIACITAMGLLSTQLNAVWTAITAGLDSTP